MHPPPTRRIDANVLVEIVSSLAQQQADYLVGATSIVQHCAATGIDTGRRGHTLLQKADHEEASGARRLLKLKRTPTHRGRVFFALSAHEAEARAGAHRSGWTECTWRHGTWAYE